MCSVGDAFNIDIAEDAGLCEMICNDCGKQFKGIRMGKSGKSLKCPECHSANTSIKAEEK